MNLLKIIRKENNICMNGIFKKAYYKIICYNPIIETLYTPQTRETSNDSSEKTYVASPMFLTRKQKRQFQFTKNEVMSKINKSGKSK